MYTNLKKLAPGAKVKVSNTIDRGGVHYGVIETLARDMFTGEVIYLARICGEVKVYHRESFL